MKNNFSILIIIQKWLLLVTKKVHSELERKNVTRK